MIGIGTDIVEISKIDISLKKSDLLDRCFCRSEIEYYSLYKKITFLAGRFAAKEATVKALGTGLINGLSLQDVEIVKSPSGAPTIILHDKALEIAQTLGVTKLFVSISHTESYATAVVILE